MSVRPPALLRLIAFAIPLLAAVAVHLALPPNLRANESADYTTFYLPVGTNLAHGHGLTTDDQAFADRYPPGYPVVIAAEVHAADAFGVDPSSLITLGTFLAYALGALLLSEIARTFLTDEMACASALAWGLSPIGLWLVKQPNSEVVFAALVLGAVLLLVRDLEGGEARGFGWPMTVGVLLGLAALIRPVGIALIVPIGATVLLRRQGAPVARALATVAMMSAAFFLAVLPWEAALHNRTGSWAPLSTGGPPSMRDGLTFDSPGLPPAARDIMVDVEHDQARLNTTGDILRYLASASKARPAAVAELMTFKLARSWYATESGRYQSMLLMLQIPFLGLSLGGLLRARGRSGAMGLLTMLVTGYSWLVTVSVLSIARYMMVPIILLMPFTVIGLPGVLGWLVAKTTLGARWPSWVVPEERP